jgi:hypothetical protein
MLHTVQAGLGSVVGGLGGGGGGNGGPVVGGFSYDSLRREVYTRLDPAGTDPMGPGASNSGQLSPSDDQVNLHINAIKKNKLSFKKNAQYKNANNRWLNNSTEVL